MNVDEQMERKIEKNVELWCTVVETCRRRGLAMGKRG